MLKHQKKWGGCDEKKFPLKNILWNTISAAVKQQNQ